MINRFLLFLGPARARTLFLLIAGTGLVSLVLNVLVDEFTWVQPVQTLLALGAIAGTAVIILGKLDPEDRGRALAILLPSLGAIILGLTVLPNLLLPLVGAALGWVVAGFLVFRSRGPMEYQQAVRHLRKNEYGEAVKIMDGLIKKEPETANHYRFRAELQRLWGKLDRARRDYERMTELDPESAVAFNGLAEVYLQSGDYPAAMTAARTAADLAPDEWVALYNLGMIADRLGESQQAVENLEQAAALRVPDARHRLLIQFYLARAYMRLGDQTAAEDAVAAMRRQRGGLDEWQKILASDQATTLRAVLGDDVQAAQGLIDGTVDVTALAETAG
ncbi:MAG: tetratricopeptide repeat protein [Chloroflexi bacterium]|nr:tetratricopeptide repeat protein [Chloroflexota bacterium]